MVKHRFALCLSNEDFEGALEPRKIYEVLVDPDSEREGLLRVVDESGEDYLYPREMFEPVEVSESAAIALFSAVG